MPGRSLELILALALEVVVTWKARAKKIKSQSEYVQDLMVLHPTPPVLFVLGF